MVSLVGTSLFSVTPLIDVFQEFEGTLFVYALASRITRLPPLANELPRAWSASISLSQCRIPLLRRSLDIKMMLSSLLLFPARSWVVFPLPSAAQRIPQRVAASVRTVTMHPMPVSPFTDADVFDCIQKGDVDQCVLFVQNDRSVLRHRGKAEWIGDWKVRCSSCACCSCICSIHVCSYRPALPPLCRCQKKCIGCNCHWNFHFKTSKPLINAFH